ncbi:MAG: hypothetical protein ACTHM6_13555 [Tepidisphaeraceae bacterium]
MSPLLADALFNDKNAPYVIIGVGVCMMIYILIRPKLRRKKDPFEKPFKTRSLAQQRSVERQMETLLVELSEMSRQMSAQLDTRATKLELLIKEADEKIAAWKALSQQAPPTPAQRFAEPGEPEAPIVKAKPAPAPEAPLIDPQHAEIYRRVDEGQSIPEIAAAMNRPNGEIQLILALRPN